MSTAITAVLTFALPLAAPAIDCDAPDHTAAIQSMLAAGIAQTNPQDPLRFQRVPPVNVDLTECPVYRVSDTLHAFGGELTCAPGGRIEWTSTSTGIVVHGPDARIGTVVHQGTSRLFGLTGTPMEGFGAAKPQIIRNCELRSTSYWFAADQRASAIVARRGVRLERTRTYGWSGDSVNIDCDIHRNPGYSECSSSSIDDHEAVYTGGDALYTGGGDANGLDIHGLGAWHYIGWCIHAAGFLASYYTALMCHGDSKAKGAILSTSLNAQSQFSGYVEGSQLIDVSPPAIVYTMQGGALSARTKMIGNFIVGSQFRPATGGGETMLWPPNEADTAARMTMSGSDTLRLRYSSGIGWFYDLQAFGAYRPIVFTDRNSMGKPRGRLWLPSGYLVGAVAADVRWEACPPTADPASRPLASVVHCTNPVLGQALEWVVATSSISSARIWAPH